MSIILDALRKSEAARRRHQAPELFAEMHDRAPASRARTRWPVWMLIGIPGLGIGALAVALWLMTRMATAPSATDTRNAAGDASVVDATTIDTSAADTVGTNADIDSDTASKTLASPLDRPLDAPNAAATAATTQADRAPVVAQPVVPATSTATRATPIAPSVATPSIPAQPKPVTAPIASQDTTTVAATTETASPPAFRSPGNDAPMALGDLDADTRKQLPPLKLSMHMWHDAPAQRFVILDGQRLREGDVIGDVVVQRITRDGATLSWRGTALKIEWR
ncbi:MAG: general secretion pathway protein GspB [Xanthomonadaceae bacterium]|nr:general secretion pathway protein GspB [Xanthomonadaceae bacterium]